MFPARTLPISWHEIQVKRVRIGDAGRAGRFSTSSGNVICFSFAHLSPERNLFTIAVTVSPLFLLFICASRCTFGVLWDHLIVIGTPPHTHTHIASVLFALCYLFIYSVRRCFFLPKFICFCCWLAVRCLLVMAAAAATVAALIFRQCCSPADCKTIL